MPFLQCTAIRWASDDFPGWVEIEVADVAGRVWTIIEKVRVLGGRGLSSGSPYPMPLRVECEVAGPTEDGGVPIRLCHGVEAADGTVTFVVASERLEGE